MPSFLDLKKSQAHSKQPIGGDFEEQRNVFDVSKPFKAPCKCVDLMMPCLYMELVTLVYKWRNLFKFPVNMLMRSQLCVFVIFESKIFKSGDGVVHGKGTAQPMKSMGTVVFWLSGLSVFNHLHL